MNNTTQNLKHKNIGNKKDLDAEMTYQINGTSFVVQPIFKEKSSETLGSTSDMFLSSVRKYTRARKLTPRMLNELIDKIEVYHAEKIDGKKVQRLKIHYNCIGAIEIPDFEKLPQNNVQIHTRQGVDVHYTALAV